MHRQIDIIINKLKSDLNIMDSKYMISLNKQENKIKQILSEITQTMDVLETLMKFGDVGLVSAYESRNAEFRILPSKLVVTLPNFTPQEINKEYLKQQLGYLS